MSEATKKLDELIAFLPSTSRRLHFTEKCAAYYAIQRTFPQFLVAKAFGVSSGMISILANCRMTDRHQDVAREFDKLGLEAFGEKYFTDDMEAKFQRFRMGNETDADLVHMRGPDPRGGRWAKRWFITEGPNEFFSLCLVAFRNGPGADIDYRTDETLKAGWAWREATEHERQTFEIRHAPNEAPPWSNHRWQTASRAIDGCYEAHGSDSERLEPDWPNHRDLKTGYRNQHNRPSPS